jgi:hypothetical protein
LIFRGNPLLNAFRDTYFREKGACIHSFVQINPDTVIAGAAHRSFAVDRPFVYPLAAPPDPRTPSNMVPACVKWINDELDDKTSLSDVQPAGDLAARADAAHVTSIQESRALSAPSCNRVIKLATARDGQASNRAASEDDADAWDADERGALGHVVNTLDLFGVCGGVTAGNPDAGLATVSIGGKRTCRRLSRKKAFPSRLTTMMKVLIKSGRRCGTALRWQRPQPNSFTS